MIKNMIFDLCTMFQSNVDVKLNKLGPLLLCHCV